MSRIVIADLMKQLDNMKSELCQCIGNVYCESIESICQLSSAQHLTSEDIDTVISYNRFMRICANLEETKMLLQDRQKSIIRFQRTNVDYDFRSFGGYLIDPTSLKQIWENQLTRDDITPFVQTRVHNKHTKNSANKHMKNSQINTMPKLIPAVDAVAVNSCMYTSSEKDSMQRPIVSHLCHLRPIVSRPSASPSSHQKPDRKTETTKRKRNDKFFQSAFDIQLDLDDHENNKKMNDEIEQQLLRNEEPTDSRSTMVTSKQALALTNNRKVFDAIERMGGKIDAEAYEDVVETLSIQSVAEPTWKLYRRIHEDDYTKHCTMCGEKYYSLTYETDIRHDEWALFDHHSLTSMKLFRKPIIMFACKHMFHLHCISKEFQIEPFQQKYCSLCPFPLKQQNVNEIVQTAFLEPEPIRVDIDNIEKVLRDIIMPLNKIWSVNQLRYLKEDQGKLDEDKTVIPMECQVILPFVERSFANCPSKISDRDKMQFAFQDCPSDSTRELFLPWDIDAVIDIPHLSPGQLRECLYRIVRKHDKNWDKDWWYQKFKKTKIPYHFRWWPFLDYNASEWNDLCETFGIDWICHPMAMKNCYSKIYGVFGREIRTQSVLQIGVVRCIFLRLYQHRSAGIVQGFRFIEYKTIDPYYGPHSWNSIANGRDVYELQMWRQNGFLAYEEWLKHRGRFGKVESEGINNIVLNPRSHTSKYTSDLYSAPEVVKRNTLM